MKAKNKRNLIDFVCFLPRLGLMFPGPGIRRSDDMINGSNSDPCSYLLSSECVPFWLTRTGVVGNCSQVKLRVLHWWTFSVSCVCVCVRAVVRVITVGVSLMWHHRRGHITVSDSPRRRGAVWVMRPPGLQRGQRWCCRRCTMRASVCVFVQQTERLHTNTAARRVD